MKAFLVLFVATVAADLTFKFNTSFDLVTAAPLNNSEDDTDGWFVPSGFGTFIWQSKKQFLDELLHFEPRDVPVQYYLYTQSSPNSPQQLFLNDNNTLSSSSWDKDNPTRFIIHGFQNNYTSEVNVMVREALMQSGTYNVICVDWSSAAQTLDYISARNAVPTVGQEVATFIDFLNSKGELSFDTLTLIGHSLGAHVCGFAGKLVTSGTVDVIIGMDPAFPLFVYADCATRLCSTDASFVETIQTCGGRLGFLQPIGELAFYPNGGQYQPGCTVDLTGACAHSRSYIYYSEALVKNDFLSNKCQNYYDALANNCDTSYSNVKMGSPESYGTSGVYYVPVNSQSPYGMG